MSYKEILELKRNLTLDVVTQDLAVALGTALSEALSSLAAARHGCLSLFELTGS